MIPTTRFRIALLMPILLFGCSKQSEIESTPSLTEEAEIDIVVSSTRIEESALNICIAEEPDSLFLYGNSSEGTASILQSIYDGPIDTRSYGFQPVILEKLPSLADGDAFFESVSVFPGDLIMDAAGELQPLESGVVYLPAGCNDTACEVIYSSQSGDAISMDQMVVEFVMLPGITWSDGRAVSADDSIFSFEMAEEIAVALKAKLIARTSVYKELAVNIVEWRGIPGYRDPNYATNFFAPLPRHAWGELSVEAVLTSDEVNKTPLAYGPYKLDEWIVGHSITLSKNGHYFRASEGLPNFDIIKFRFVGSDGEAAIFELLNGGCDVLDESIDVSAQIERLLELQADGQILLSFTDGADWEHLDFGIQPISYDDVYNTAQGDRPDFFGDVRTRQAIAMCLDRQTLVDQLAYGQGTVLDAYVASSHPLYNPDAAKYNFDIEVGAALLEQVGWVMGEEGVRVARGVVGIPEGSLLELEYFTTDSLRHQEIAQILGQSLAECGIRINISKGSPQELFAPGPDGLLFGRQFDLAQFAWPLEREPSCYLYFGGAIPGGDIDQFPYLWGGWNLTGWRNAEYEAACLAARNALPGEEEYLANYLLAQHIFAAELPVIPLFIYTKFTAARADLCGLMPDPTANLFWNIESLGYGDNCMQTP